MNRFFTHYGHTILILLGLSLIGACTSDLPSESPKPQVASPAVTTPVREDHPSEKADAVYWPIGTRMLDAAAVAAEELSASIDQLLQQPNVELLNLAQKNWRVAATSFEMFYVFTRLGVVQPQGFAPMLDHHFNIAAWPIQPGYLDGYGAHPYSGLVFDVGVPISAEAVREQHGMTDRSDAALGFYALEFLLFGEHYNRGPLAFLPIVGLSEQHRLDGYTTPEELPRNRRREIIRLQGKLVANDIARIRSTWEDKNPHSLGMQFQQLPAPEREALLKQAAASMVTEQITAIAGATSPVDLPSDAKLRQNQALADRLLHQLIGWKRVAQAMYEEQHDLINLTEEAATAMQALIDLPPIDPSGDTTIAQWQGPFRALSDLAHGMREPAEQAENAARPEEPKPAADGDTDS